MIPAPDRTLLWEPSSLRFPEPASGIHLSLLHAPTELCLYIYMALSLLLPYFTIVYLYSLEIAEADIGLVEITSRVPCDNTG